MSAQLARDIGDMSPMTPMTPMTPAPVVEVLAQYIRRYPTVLSDLHRLPTPRARIAVAKNDNMAIPHDPVLPRRHLALAAFRAI